MLIIERHLPSIFTFTAPPIPPYVRLRTRRFRAFSSHDVWQVAFSYPFEYLYCYLTTFLPDSTHPLYPWSSSMTL